MPSQVFYVAALLIPLISGALNCQAATLSRQDGSLCNYVLNGPIESDDSSKVENAIEQGMRSLCLDSGGGSYSEGIKISEALITSSVKTVLPPGSRCYSACAIVFMAGSEFEDVLMPDRSMHHTARLGFHAPYLNLQSDRQFSGQEISVAYHVGLNAVAKMMALGSEQYGRGRSSGVVPNALILEMLKAGPNELFKVDTVGRAKALSIKVFGLPRLKADVSAACNACRNLNVDDADDLGASSPTCDVGKVSKKRNNVTEVLFKGYGAEAMGMCVAQVRGGGSGGGAVYVVEETLWEDELPAAESRFKSVDPVLYYPPEYKLGVQ